MRTRWLVLSLLARVAVADDAVRESSERNFAGSVQLDYLANPRGSGQPDQGLRGGTVELSLKLTMDFGDHISSNIKVCFACHGFELGMAFFDLRVSDELNFRVGRFTPAFGSFPLRSDPANHSTSDKPLPYDMGRMTRLREWNEGILPAPWVDNGIEVNGTHFIGKSQQLDYAAYAIGGPKGDDNAVDFDFKLSRSPERYYVDNNVEPAVGARVALTVDIAPSAILTLGSSAMIGHYDPQAHLGFAILGADASLQLGTALVRAEYLIRRTEIALGEDPAARFKYGPAASGKFANHVLKDGFVAEAQIPVGKFELIGRWDGLRRVGNVLATSTLRSNSVVLRHTAGMTYRLIRALRLKTSVELYDFSDFEDELVVHVGLAGSF
ncbi:MAG: hypothetical protein WKG01_32980 [Kofleriaceae bacterium]